MPLYVSNRAGKLEKVPKLDLVEEKILEDDIEEVVWNNIPGLFGPDIFPVARQTRLDDARRMDILCLHRSGQVVIIELKRDGDRKQLSQILEYAGWAHRYADLQSIGNLYHKDQDTKGFVAFIKDWQQFTETAHLVEIQKNSPQLFLIAGKFEDRTEDAIEYLRKTGAKIETMELTFYGNFASGSFEIHVKSSASLEPKKTSTISFETVEEKSIGSSSDSFRIFEKRILEEAIAKRRAWASFFPTLVAENLLQVGDEFEIVKKDKRYKLRLLKDGKFASIDTGTIYSSPTAAAMGVLGKPTANGWDWLCLSGTGTSLAKVRNSYLERVAAA